MLRKTSKDKTGLICSTRNKIKRVVFAYCFKQIDDNKSVNWHLCRRVLVYYLSPQNSGCQSLFKRPGQKDKEDKR